MIILIKATMSGIIPISTQIVVILIASLNMKHLNSLSVFQMAMNDQIIDFIIILIGSGTNTI